MRLLIRLFILGMLLSTDCISASAQVQQRWHLRLTEPDPNAPLGQNSSGHSIEAMALDGDGNIFLAGDTMGFSGGAYVTKCSSAGQVLWEKHFDKLLVDSLVVTGSGNSFVSLHAISNETNAVSLVKLDPIGGEVWRTDPETNTVGIAHVSSLAQNSQGDLFWLTLLAIPDPVGDPEKATYPWIVSKFSADGRRLWRTELPSGHQPYGDGRPLESLAADPDGGVVIAGFRCTRLNGDGTLRWTVLPPLKSGEYGGIFSTVALAASGAAIAGGEVISPDGKATQAGWPGVENRVIGSIPGEGFLTSVAAGLWCIDEQGAERWHVWLGNLPATRPEAAQTPAFAFSPAGDGWFAFAQDDYNGGLSIWRFENDGRLRWRQRVSDLSSDHLRLSATPDGKLVAAVGEYVSFGYYLPAEVFSFSIAEDPAAPHVTRSPSAPDWDGLASLSLSVEAVGDSLSYQWRRVWQVCAGETNSTITLKPSLGSFAEPGSYWCEVSNSHGTAASRMASVTLAQPRMTVCLTNAYFSNLLQLDATPILGFESAKVIDQPFEVSTNLVDWVVGPSVTNWLKRYDGHSIAGVAMPVSGATGEYYRLRQTEATAAQSGGAPASKR